MQRGTVVIGPELRVVHFSWDERGQIVGGIGDDMHRDQFTDSLDSTRAGFDSRLYGAEFALDPDNHHTGACVLNRRYHDGGCFGGGIGGFDNADQATRFYETEGISGHCLRISHTNAKVNCKRHATG